MADKKPHDERQRDESNLAWERFRLFVGKVAAVSKDEADEKRRNYEQ
jgi:hypothetical protein